MKEILFLLLIFLFSFLLKAQESVIRFDIRNNASKDIYILNNDYSNAEVMFGDRGFDLPLESGKGSHIFKFTKPTFINVYYRADSTQEHTRYSFFLSPGDNLEFSADALRPVTSCVVTGKGSQNNQPLAQEIINPSFRLDEHKKDTLPDRVFETLQNQETDHRLTLKKYIKTYRPTQEFIKSYSLLVASYLAREYIGFKGNHKFNISKAYYRNENSWQAIEDSLIAVHPLNNDELLEIPDHVYFLPTYVTRVKERLWKNPALLTEYFSSTEAATIMTDDPQNLPQEKIINKHFTGKTAEFLSAALLKDAINENEDNVVEIFGRFKQAYPTSKYLPYIEPDIIKIKERNSRTLTDEMKIVENSSSFETFEDVLKLVNGKTVLLDMWGTWCGPCRSELAKNGDAIKTHFKGKGLEYLYIANYDEKSERKWKALIPYYNMIGIHILASKSLTNDIMAKIKGNGFPTYVIIKKDGSLELSEAGYPMDREVLFKQLDRALN